MIVRGDLGLNPSVRHADQSDVAFGKGDGCRDHDQQRGANGSPTAPTVDGETLRIGQEVMRIMHGIRVPEVAVRTCHTRQSPCEPSPAFPQVQSRQPCLLQARQFFESASRRCRRARCRRTGGIVRAIRLGRAMMSIIRQNMFFAFLYNALGIPIAAGVLFPIVGVLMSRMLAGVAMSFSSVSVIANALRLRRARLD